MSGREQEWAGLATGDNRDPLRSINSKSRTEPPDKRAAGGSRAAYGAHRDVVSPETRQPFSPAAGQELTSRGRAGLCSQRSEPDPGLGFYESALRVGGVSQLTTRGQSPKQLLELRRHSCGKDTRPSEPPRYEHLTPDPTRIQDGGKGSSSLHAGSILSETDILLAPKRGLNGGQTSDPRKNYATLLDNLELTFTSPRYARCTRQSRVESPEKPDTNHPSPNDSDTHSADAAAKAESGCKLYLDGKSLDVANEQASIEANEDQDTALFSPVRHEGVSHRLSCDTKRSSADRESVISVTTSDDRPSESCGDAGGKKKKKRKNRHGTGSDKERSSLSLSPTCRGNSDSGSVNDDANRPPSSSSNSKGGHRRFAKRGLGGGFPSSNWRRLRNTLKAANEMQSNKKTKHALNREDSFLRKFSTRNHQNVQNASLSTDEDAPRYQSAHRKCDTRLVIQHDGNFMFYWLGVVTISVLYNIWTPIAREAFREIQEGCNVCWFVLDAVFDFIYICDIVVQFRTGYLDQGLMVYDSKKLRERYTKSKVIYIDFLCLLPLDLIQFVIGIHPMIRFPRFLKVYRTFRFLHMMESRTAYPNLIRVANLTHILFLGAHWFAAFYYMISEAEDFSGDWAYPKPVGIFADVNRKYLRSLFWSTLTLTTIGDLPPPENNSEYVFVIVSYLIGVFVFATIVGQVGNVINNRNASRQEFERLLDGAKIYMQTHNVPHNLQKRVQRWYDYVWSRGRLNGCDINSLGLLPDKLKTELAIHVNLETLKKVTIFQECQPEFLHDLVLKMKAYIFTPGDLICRRGEVAREMFIIADGVVEIISETGVMLKRMGAGDFFGEIGILNLDGGINRRTADVRSVGYLELFVLSREDVLEALKDHPEAESIIRDYGQRRLREVEAHRQRVKPLKCRGSTDQPGSFSAGSQTVQNRLLQTLRSLNPAVRRQSAQINNHVGGSPPAASLAGNGPPSGNQRGQNSDGEVQFTFDTKDAEISPKLRLNQKNFERQGSGNGRSHAMSIIQSQASDLSYQNLAAQIQLMQGMIDKRLSQLEEVYISAFSRIDTLAATQTELLQLFKKFMNEQEEKTDQEDDNGILKSSRV